MGTKAKFFFFEEWDPITKFLVAFMCGTRTVTDLIYFFELEPMRVGAVLYLYESGKKSDSTQKTFVQSYLQFCED
jgi:hypothetical protein